MCLGMKQKHFVINIFLAESEGGVEKDAVTAKDQLSKMIEKYWKDGGGFDLDDLDEDFDDLGIDDDLSCSENDD